MSRRIEIMRRATEIFAKKGFADTALQDIADAAGVKLRSAGTLRDQPLERTFRH